ncbi:hypothetical protein A3K73_06860 [Candidatus Pacearchaeota archaeon RBG_13_36_9]|nr:MAG: hypothetical protein A3K73_06860 [Candidatus Pacearchaeota archaeon RBG_13_36_9]
MSKVTIGGIVTTSIISAFTIAAALIWKDVIDGAIKLIFPADQLLLKFIAAILATVLVVVFIYAILVAQSETKMVLRKLNTNNRRKKK